MLDEMWHEFILFTHDYTESSASAASVVTGTINRPRPLHANLSVPGEAGCTWDSRSIFPLWGDGEQSPVLRLARVLPPTSRIRAPPRPRGLSHLPATPGILMGALKGSVTVRRYVVKGKAPTDKGRLVKGVRAHILLPIDPATEVERSHGWALAEDPEVLELSSDNIFVGGALVLALRIDTLKPPSAVVKRLVAEKLRALGRKPGKREKQEAKDWVVKSLRARVFPTMKSYELVWQMDENRLYFFAHAKGPNELLVDLFNKTFGVELVACGPGVIAAEGGRLPAALAPTPELAFGFAGLPGRPIAGEDGEFGFGDESEVEVDAEGFDARR